MTRNEYLITMPYEFDPNRKGAKYKIGNAFKNNGEFLESIAKHHRGLEYLVNPTTRWDNGSDIESEHASVKSGKASLATIYGNSLNEILDIYFEKVASTKWLYLVRVEESVVEYEMNATEFRAFMETWGRISAESGSHKMKAKILPTSMKMIKWLEERVAC